MVSETDWHDCTSDIITDLAPAVYQVRLKADNNNFASYITTVTINREEVKTFHVVIGNGTGTNDYKVGDKVTIVAKEALQGMAFDKWVSNVEIEYTDDTNANLSTAVFIMPQSDVELTATYKDISAPTGQITISTNKWNDFCNKITFGIFFKETQKINITAEDIGLGVDKIYYYISQEPKSMEDIKSLNDLEWTEYKEEFSIKPDKSCVVYAKITDKGGNEKYLSSDGLVFDATSPTITGVKNNESYKESVEITVTDDNLDYLEIDGKIVGYENGNYKVDYIAGSHIIKAVDKAGNMTQLTINMVKEEPTTEEVTTKPEETTTKEVTTKPEETTTEEVTTKPEETTTEKVTTKPAETTKPTEATTKVTQATTKPTEATTKVTEATTETIQEPTQAEKLEISADGNWYYTVDGVTDYNYNGLAENEYGWWKVSNGEIDFSYNGLADNKYGWWKITNGTVDFNANGLILDETTATWWYFNGGAIDFNYTGLAENEYGWWKVSNGKVDLSFDGLALNEYGWGKISNGVIDLSYNGISSNEYGTWKVISGTVDLTANGLIFDDITDKWWYFNQGAIDFNYTGLALNEYNWWKISNGTLDLSYTGLALNEYGWWKVTNGVIDLNYNGIASNQYGTWKVTSGTVDFTANGLIFDSESDKWWYFNGGAIDFSYTGLALNEYNWWKISNGTIDFNYSGLANNQYGTWNVVNGQVVL